MDKLINISRQGGYPLCAETLQVLYNNAKAVNVLLAGLNLPNNSAVILWDESSETRDVQRYLYVFTTDNRRLVRYTRGIGVSMSDLTSAKLVITEESVSVHDSEGNEIEDVYSIERAVIEHTNVESEKWKFYKLEDVLEFAIFTDMLPEFQALIALTGISLDGNYNNMLEKNSRKLMMRLKLNVSVQNNSTAINSPTYTLQVPMPFVTHGALSVNMSMLYNNNYYPMRAMLMRNVLKVYAGEVLNDITTTDTILYSQSWTMFVNAEILL